jgi:PAS domain S-box-containing protein
MIHHLLQQQLARLGLDTTPPTTAEQWADFLTAVDTAYHNADNAQDQWKEAYDLLRDEMEGSVESLRRSSAHIITRERDKLQAIIRALGDGLCALNENGCLLFMNPEGERLLGWSEVELRGQLFLDWVMPSTQDEDTTEHLLKKVKSGEPHAELDATFIQRNGRYLPVSYTLDPIFNDGQFTGAVLVFRDISAYKRSQEEREQQLRETLVLNRVIAAATSSLDLNTVLKTICKELALFFDLPQAAFGLLNEKRDQLTIVAEYLTAGRLPALGTVIPIENNPATQEVITSKKPLVIPDAQTDPRQPELHDLSRRRGTRTIMIVPLLVRDEVLGTLGLNSTYHRNFSPAEIELAQNVASAASQAVENAQLYAAVQQELAERERTEVVLAQTRDKALEASRLKSELIAKVSHDLRTPLTSIIGFAEMIQLGLYGPVTAEQKDTLDKIMQSGEDLVVLVNDLLDLSQLEAGTLRLNAVPMAPASIITRMENMMRLLAGNKGLTLVTELSPDLPEQIVGDPDRLHQILINLVSNALKFTEQGEVCVAIRLLSEQAWGLIVSDTGQGIPEELHETIFEEFRQAEFAPNAPRRGVGLGLSIVKQITAAMGGSIKLESNVGEGSTFTVMLPLIDASKQAKQTVVAAQNKAVLHEATHKDK